MGYQIAYDSVGGVPQKPKKRWTGILAVAVVLLIVAGAMTVKNVGLEWVQEVLLPGDPSVTAAALEGMAQDLRSGESVVEALRNFCQEIMRHAEAVQ